MWFHRALHRLNPRRSPKKPKFREINWADDGEVRPVTRGKAKQFGRSEDAPTGPSFPSDAACRIKSNLSYSSQAPLTKSDGVPDFRYEKRVEGEGRRRYFTARLKE